MNHSDSDLLFFPTRLKGLADRNQYSKYVRAIRRLDLDFLEDTEVASSDVTIANEFSSLRFVPNAYNLTAVHDAVKHTLIHSPEKTHTVLNGLVLRYGDTPWLPLCFPFTQTVVLYGQEEVRQSLSETFLWYWPQYVRQNVRFFVGYGTNRLLKEGYCPGFADMKLGLRPCTREQRVLDIDRLSKERRQGQPPALNH